MGNKFLLRTDHKPLLTIFGENKGLPLMAAARVQRWAFILSGFNYSIEYVKVIANDADNLSRMPHVENSDETFENSYINVIEQENSLNLSFKDIAIETRRDPVQSRVSVAILSGKISDMKEKEFLPFRNKASELTVEQGCI